MKEQKYKHLTKEELEQIIENATVKESVEEFLQIT